MPLAICAGLVQLDTPVGVLDHAGVAHVVVGVAHGKVQDVAKQQLAKLGGRIGAVFGDRPCRCLHESVRPNHMWHLDYVHQHINRASTYTLILIDDHSRFVVGHGVDDAERADLVIETFEEAVRRYSRPEMVMHEKGSAFWSWRGISRLTKLLVELGVDQIAAEHQEWNGKVEVFNANLQRSRGE